MSLTCPLYITGGEETVILPPYIYLGPQGEIYHCCTEEEFTTPQIGEITLSTSHDSGYGEPNLECFESVVEWRAQKLAVYSPYGHSSAENIADGQNTGFEEYIDNIYKHRLSAERRFHPHRCLAMQSEVTPGMRGLLVNWISKIHHQLALNQDTLFLTVNIIDRILACKRLSADGLQLLGLTCLLVASKQEEVTPPEIQELFEVSTVNYSREELKTLERHVLMAIGFDLFIPTSQYFLEHFATLCLSQAYGFENDKLREARAFSRCILELSLQDYDLCQFRPSLVALCMWKVAIEHIGVLDGDFFPDGIYCTRGQYDKCLEECRVFSKNLKTSFPDISSLSDRFRFINGFD
ncbi:cyclin-O [Patella vulgata]|uniref:cyclin-O n=1 Tax=Patella vulgata TaxID=6465 RepID=UPI00217FAD6B|nr:cyclin-O [Patella vulgata]